MTAPLATFVYMTCRPGAESALKQEVARTQATWRLAFSRPGFVTFKLPDAEAYNAEQLAAMHWTFARAHGISLGRVAGTATAELVGQLWQLDAVAALAAGEAIADVHVWERQPESVENSETIESPAELLTVIESAIRAAAPESCVPLHKPIPGARRATHRDSIVLDVVVVGPKEWWIGTHVAKTLPQRWPGGAIPVVLPKHAVSRAYSKMEEALAWSDLPLAAGDECAEIGCAPGGASQALLDRGLFVTGIDPAEVDPSVLAHPRFRHLRKRGKEVRRGEFVGVRWLMADVNLAPTYTLDSVEAIVKHPDVAIRGMVLTLKLADWSLAEGLPEFIKRVRSWGYRDVRVRQLASGGREVCLVALRRRELRRLNRKRKSSGSQASARAGTGAKAGKVTAIEHVDGPHPSVSGPHF